MTASGGALRPLVRGARAGRLEDDALLSGTGSYVADIALPGMVEMVVVRSFLAHAVVRNVGLGSARSSKGVLAAYSGADLEDVSSFPDFIDHARPVQAFPLSRDRVRYVGAPIAAVVAEDRYVAEDAAELVEVELEELPVVASLDSALSAEAPLLFEDWPDNVVVDVHMPDPQVDEIMGRARVIRGTYNVQRHFAVPMETRGSVAEWKDGRLTLWTANQSPHIVRTTLSYVLGLPESIIRVIAPDVGGGFGCKTHVYPEDVLVCRFAMSLGRPVRWIEDRHEHMVSSAHAREQVHELEGAVDDTGRLLALRCRILHDVGSGEIFPPGFNPSFVGWAVLTGPYRIPHVEGRVTCVVTNKTPSGAYRGFGVPEVVFAMERFVEKVAAEFGVDALDLRREMIIDSDELPYELRWGSRLDSGSYREAFERSVKLGTDSLNRALQTTEDGDSVRLGVGYATYVEPTVPTYFATTGNWTSHDACTIRIEPDGSAVVTAGVTSAGQGLKTMVATVAAEALGIAIDNVNVVLGDTDLCPYGLGGWGSRSTAVATGAILKAAEALKKKILAISEHLIEVPPEDLVIERGRVHAVGSEKPAVSLAEVARVAYVRTLDLPPDIEPGLTATSTYDPPGLDHRPDEHGRMNGGATYTNHSHAAVVRVQLETGEVEVLDYIVVHDCGRVINPLIVEGQIHGGVAQGLGGALYEQMVYGADGQPLTTTFMDYLVPSSLEVPPMLVEHLESPAPEMPLGVKGVGEGGTIGPLAAVANAVASALSDFGIDITATPITPTLIRRMLRRSTGDSQWQEPLHA